MQNKTMRFLKVSLIIVIVACVVLFTSLGLYMNKKSEDAIDDVGTIYMSGLNERIGKHFKTIIDMRLSYLESIIREVPPDSTTSYEDMCKSLSYSGEARDFHYLALYDYEGNFDMIYGDHIELADPESFLNSMNHGDKKIAVGKTDAGEDVVMMGIPITYSMKNGDNGLAIVAGLPASYIKAILSLDDDDDMVYSHVIRKDGSFVIKSADEVMENYFDRIRTLFGNSDIEHAEYNISDLKKAMENQNDFSSIFNPGSLERRHVYCTALPYSEWYLITVMPYGILDKTVNGFSTLWIFMSVASCSAIVILLIIIFVKYFGITARQIKELDEARIAAESATKAKSEFLSNMSHDIRTPMNAIVGMTAIATSNIENKEQVANCLRKITLSSKHLLGLINDILDMSKIESGKLTLTMEQISLREVMESIVNVVQPQIKAKKQHFDVFISNIETEEVYCDSIRLNQVLINLLSNAIKFTPENGNIEVSLYEENSPLGEDYVRVHISVKDNGIGMSEEFTKIVFESFAREDSKRVHKTEGTGLGMAITKYIVDAMNGSIIVKSKQNKGTEFKITLDFEKAEEREEDMLLPDWNMLLVDDDEMLCESATESLKEIGIKAEWTLDGETAIKMVSERHNTNNDYDVILIDWKLPGIDGITTAQEIRNLTDIPILLISAYDWNDIEEEAKSVGISGFIAKPLFKSTLYYGLKQIVADDLDQNTEKTKEFDLNISGKRILLSEDNELNWEIANELLSSQGLILDHAENGQVCVEKFKESKIGYYDLILMDLRMPIMNGYEATDAIRASNRSDSNIPIIAMTADAFSDDKKKCIEHGMNAHVAKPIDIQEVIRLIIKYTNDDISKRL